MFKNFVTYNFVLSFHRSCTELDAPLREKERVLRSAELLTCHFNRAVRAKAASEQSRFYFVSLQALRDCHEFLREFGLMNADLESKFQVLHPRLEQLCLDSSDGEGGQLRMLG